MSLVRTIKKVEEFAEVTFTGNGEGVVSLNDILIDGQYIDGTRNQITNVLSEIKYKIKTNAAIYTQKDVIIWAMLGSTSEDFKNQLIGFLPNYNGLTDIKVVIEGSEPGTVKLIFHKRLGFYIKQ